MRSYRRRERAKGRERIKGKNIRHSLTMNALGGPGVPVIIRCHGPVMT